MNLPPFMDQGMPSEQITIAEGKAVNLKDRHIVLGVSGSISAYKSVEIVRELIQAGADVRVVPPRRALRWAAGAAPAAGQAVTR